MTYLKAAESCQCWNPTNAGRQSTKINNQ